MGIMKKLTLKERILIFLLTFYIGAFGYYWGVANEDPYLIIVIVFLITQLLGNIIILGYILQNNYVYKVKNKYVRLLINFVINVVFVNIIIFLLSLIYEGELNEILEGPMVFGLIYGVMYFIYILLILKDIENE